MIPAHPGAPSVAPGGVLSPHVATDSARFRVAFHRWGGGPQSMLRSGWLPGADARARGPDQDWDWPSGVYIAEFEEEWHRRSFDPACGDGAASCVVRARTSRTRGRGRADRSLYEPPLATCHACNDSGGGIGGTVWCAADHDDAGSPRQCFAHWDARMRHRPARDPTEDP